MMFMVLLFNFESTKGCRYQMNIHIDTFLSIDRMRGIKHTSSINK